MGGRSIEPEAYLLPWLRDPPTKGVFAPVPDATCLGTRLGRGRSVNQDRILQARFADARGTPAELTLVCDGMGGMRNGDHCAEVGSTSFLLALAAYVRMGAPPRAAVQEAAVHANRRVWSEEHGSGGTTLSAILFAHREVTVCTAGDTRIFGFGQKGLHQLSHDDTVEAALAEVRGGVRGPVVPENQRLVQFLGMGSGFDPRIFRLERTDDRFVFLCTDGAYRPAGALLSQIVSQVSNVRGLVERLLSMAEVLGGPDDASVAAVDMQSMEKVVFRDDVLPGTIRVWGPAASMTGMLMGYTPDTWQGVYPLSRPTATLGTRLGGMMGGIAAGAVAGAGSAKPPLTPLPSSPQIGVGSPPTPTKADTAGPDNGGPRDRPPKKKKKGGKERTSDKTLPLPRPVGPLVIQVAPARYGAGGEPEEIEPPAKFAEPTPTPPRVAEPVPRPDEVSPSKQRRF